MTITPKAIVKLCELKTIYSDVLHVSIRSGGCSGLSYYMEWKDFKIPYDKFLILGNSEHSILVAMDSKSALFLENVTLDYEDGLNGKGFVWNNEAAKRTCGCGSSFST